MAEGRSRPAWAEVDLGAIRHNASLMGGIAAPAALCAVVKADGYGHGAVGAARAAIEGGAASLAVALVDEGVELREAGITRPVLLLSEPSADAAGTVAACGLTPTLTTPGGVAPMAAAAKALGTRVPVHVKVDTGMHRVGADPAEVAALVAAVAAEPALALEGLWTHLAVADGSSEEDRAFTSAQLDRFDAVVSDLARGGVRPRVFHAANSAGVIAWPRSHYDLVRCGISLYGQLPSPGMAGTGGAATGAGAAAGAAAGPADGVATGVSTGPAASHMTGTAVAASLRPALSLRARVSAVRRLDAGERPSYGRLRPLPARSLVATVPIGYADGVPRALFAAGYEVLIGGRRYPLAGMVTMDQIVVDCGTGGGVSPGDEVTLLGRQGDEEITASEWAGLLGTISYEVLCGIGPRVPRVVTGGPAPGREPSPAQGAGLGAGQGGRQAAEQGAELSGAQGGGR